jgi:valyl-tRNA synthetase
MSPSISPRRWYHWFHPDDTPEERKLIWKLDLLVVGYAFIVYWVSRTHFEA